MRERPGSSRLCQAESVPTTPLDCVDADDMRDARSGQRRELRVHDRPATAAGHGLHSRCLDNPCRPGPISIGLVHDFNVMRRSGIVGAGFRATGVALVTCERGCTAGPSPRSQETSRP